MGIRRLANSIDFVKKIKAVLAKTAIFINSPRSQTRRYMKTIHDINFKGKRALIRVDFNVPLDKAFNVTDDNRIRATIPTLDKILKDGGSCVLMSHLGRPKDGPEEKYSLQHTIRTTEKLLGRTVIFASDCIG